MVSDGGDPRWGVTKFQPWAKGPRSAGPDMARNGFRAFRGHLLRVRAGPPTRLGLATQARKARAGPSPGETDVFTQISTNFSSQKCTAIKLKHAFLGYNVSAILTNILERVP